MRQGTAPGLECTRLRCSPGGVQGIVDGWVGSGGRLIWMSDSSRSTGRGGRETDMGDPCVGIWGFGGGRFEEGGGWRAELSKS